MIFALCCGQHSIHPSHKRYGKRYGGAGDYLTKRNTEHDRQRGLSAGASAYITKPFDANDLQATVRSLLNNPTV